MIMNVQTNGFHGNIIKKCFMAERCRNKCAKSS